MVRKRKAYLEDILESIRRIQEYTEGMDFEKFASDQKRLTQPLTTWKTLEKQLKT